MPRLTILAKGNADVRDSLHALHEGDAVAWNGINAVLRASKPGWTARIVHETMTRSDAVTGVPGVPASLAVRDLPLGPFPLASQFTTRLFDGDADVVVISIQPDIMNHLAVARADGHLFYPYGVDHWPEDDRRWLAQNYTPSPPPTTETAMAALSVMIARIRATGDPCILVYNLSPIIPWERVHMYRGLGETLSQRIRRFNLALVDLSRDTGISIVDVDAVLARAAAERLKLDAVTLTAEACRLVAEEVVRILDDLGCFADKRA